MEDDLDLPTRRAHVVQVPEVSADELHPSRDVLGRAREEVVEDPDGPPALEERVVQINRPAQRVRYELQEIGQPTLTDVLSQFGLLRNGD